MEFEYPQEGGAVDERRESGVFKEAPAGGVCVLRQPPPHTVRSIGHGARGWLAFARVRQQDAFYFISFSLFLKWGFRGLCSMVTLAVPL